MLNVGPEENTMVFEPPLLHIEPGDTVTFAPTDRGHNAASMEGMIPAGAAPWKGAISEPITVTFPLDGTYGYICEPHYGLGMVGLVLVGDHRANLDVAQAVRQRGSGRAAVQGAIPYRFHYAGRAMIWAPSRRFRRKPSRPARKGEPRRNPTTWTQQRRSNRPTKRGRPARSLCHT
jgi:pseudoazurin